MAVIKKPKPPKKKNGRPKIERTKDGRTKSDIYGRWTVVTEEVLQKLDHAFMIGCTDTEACLFANISPRTLYYYQDKHPDFAERKEMLRKTLNAKAKANIASAIQRGDVTDSKWHLERRARDEYAPKIDHTVAGTMEHKGEISHNHQLSGEHTDMLRRLIKNFPDLIKEPLTQTEEPIDESQ